MGDNKRRVSMIEDMDTSSGAFMSKKRKSSVDGHGSSELELSFSGGHHRNSAHLCEGLHDMTVSPASSVNSAGTVVSGEIFQCKSFSCCSSNIVKTSSGVVDSTTPPTPDLEAKDFEIVESTSGDIKLFSREMFLLSESSGDSEETATFPVKSPSAVMSKQRNIPVANMPPKEEIEEFFAIAEKYEQQLFAQKYNYDIAKDVPLDGRYHWVRLH